MVSSSCTIYRVHWADLEPVPNWSFPRREFSRDSRCRSGIVRILAVLQNCCIGREIHNNYLRSFSSCRQIPRSVKGGDIAPQNPRIDDSRWLAGYWPARIREEGDDRHLVNITTENITWHVPRRPTPSCAISSGRVGTTQSPSPGLLSGPYSTIVTLTPFPR